VTLTLKLDNKKCKREKKHHNLTWFNTILIEAFYFEVLKIFTTCCLYNNIAKAISFNII